MGKDMKVVVRRNRRVPVTLDWVEVNREDLKAKIADGLIWLEDSARKRASDKMLKKLGLYTAPKDMPKRNYPTSSKAAYNDNLSTADDEESEEPEEESEEEPEEEPEETEEEADDEQEEEESEGEPEDTASFKTAGKPLPEGWKDLVKRELLTLMEERGMEIPEDQRNDNLIEHIEEWAAARGLE
jgi:hypothetical protein